MSVLYYARRCLGIQSRTLGKKKDLYRMVQFRGVPPEVISPVLDVAFDHSHGFCIKVYRRSNQQKVIKSCMLFYLSFLRFCKLSSVIICLNHAETLHKHVHIPDGKTFVEYVIVSIKPFPDVAFFLSKLTPDFTQNEIRIECMIKLQTS